MKILDIMGFRSDEKIINFSIKKARDFAWLNAMELALLHDSALERRKNEIDLRVIEIAKLIKNPPGRVINFVLRCIRSAEPRNPQILMQRFLEKA